MTLNASGPISLGGATTGQSINLELGVAATALASINATNFRTLAGVASGQISISNFYGKSNTVGNFNLNWVTSLNLNRGDTSVNVDASNNFWAASVAGGAAASGVMTLAKWNSSNVLQSIVNFGTAPVSPMTTQYQPSYGGQALIGKDGNMYLAGSQAGTQSAVNLSGFSIIRWNSAGAWSAGRTFYTFLSTYLGYNVYAIYITSKTPTVDSSSNIYYYPTRFLIWIQGYDCCGNPLYYSDNQPYIGNINSSFNHVESYSVNNLDILGDRTAFYGVTQANGDNFFVTTGQISGGGGFQTIVGKRTGTSTTLQWVKRYRTTYLGNNQIMIDDRHGSMAIDSTGAFIMCDIQNYRLMKVSSTGTFQWAFRWTFPSPSYTYNNKSTAMCVDSSDNVYVIGLVNNYNPGSSYPNRVALLKFNSSGTIQWARVISSLDTPSVSDYERSLNNPAVQARGTDLVINFTIPNSSNASYNLVLNFTYPQSGSFTGNTNITFPGSSDYYTISIDTQSITVENWTLASETTLSSSLTATGISVSQVNITNSSTTTMTASTTSVNY